MAAMEPGHEDREDLRSQGMDNQDIRAAMEPRSRPAGPSNPGSPTGPGVGCHEDREDEALQQAPALGQRAAMEPGHEDREDAAFGWGADQWPALPQWSPAMKTGKTAATRPCAPGATRRNGARP